MHESNPVLRYKNFWLVIGYALVALVIYLSLASSPVEIELDIPYQDKFFHAIEYFVLMGWFVQIYHVPSQRLLFAVAFILMGVLMEYLQSFDPARYSETGDMVANTLGVAIAVLLAKRTPFRFFLVMFERLLVK